MPPQTQPYSVLPNLTDIDIPNIAPFLVLGVLVLFAIYSFVLFYHWIRYGAGSILIWIGMGVYAVGSFFIIGLLLTSLSL